MRKIGFSHEYPKLAGQSKARLLYVGEFTYDPHDERSRALIEYDTRTCNGGRYDLRRGRYVLLLFLGDKGIPFTTIRSRIGMYGRDKWKYYNEHIGEEFEIVVKEDEPCPDLNLGGTT